MSYIFGLKKTTAASNWFPESFPNLKLISTRRKIECRKHASVCFISLINNNVHLENLITAIFFK